jgi:carbon-monoxide dehydrogenase medium subunit
MMKLRLASPGTLIDISALTNELRYVKQDGDALRIGALATHRDVLESPLVAQRARLLIDAERVIADPLVRNMGTVGGSVAHADAAEDLAAAFMALDAIVSVRGPDGARDVPIEAFYLGPYTTVLEAGEIVTEIRLPRAVGHSAYLKVERRAGDWSAAALGFTCDLEGSTLRNVRIGMCAVGQTTLRAQNAEAILEGAAPDDALLKRAGEAAAAESDPTADARGSVEFKRGLIKTLLARAVRRALDPNTTSKGASNGAH